MLQLYHAGVSHGLHPLSSLGRRRVKILENYLLGSEIFILQDNYLNILSVYSSFSSFIFQVLQMLLHF